VARPVWLCRVAGVERGRGRSPFTPWLALSRALTRVARIPLPKVNARRTVDAVRLQLLTLSAWPETGFAVQRTGDTATVWYWDEQRLREQLSAAGASLAAVAPVPESALRAHGSDDGLRLVACLDGVEGQVWRGGELAASMWWPRVPDEAAWQAFALDAGVRAAAVPVPLEVPWSARPASGVQVHRAGAAQGQWDAAAAARIATCLLGIYAIWLGVHHARVQVELNGRSDELAAIESRSAALRQARTDAQRDAVAASRLAELRPTITQADLMLALAAFSGADRQLTLREWEFREGRLRVLLATDRDRFDRAAALDALARSTLLRDVQLASGAAANTLAIVAQVAEGAPGAAPEARKP